MKLLSKSLAFIGLYLFCCSFSPVYAQGQDPADLFRALVAVMQKESSYLPLASFVDWNSALQKLSSKDKQTMGVSSAQDLKDYYQLLWSDPGEFMRKQIANNMKTLPEDKQYQLLQAQGNIVETSLKLFAKKDQALTEARIEVSGSSIRGSKAIVDYEVTYHGHTRSDHVVMLRQGDSWLLANVIELVQSGGKATPSTKVGGIVSR